MKTSHLLPDLFSENAQVILPKLWSKILPLNSNMIVFANFSKTNTGSILLFNEIQVSKTGDILYLCCGKEIWISNEQPPLRDLHTFQAALVKFDSLKLCKGKLFGNTSANNSYMDNQGTLRSNLCPLILNDVFIDVCYFCSKITVCKSKHILLRRERKNKKMCRLQKSKKGQQSKLKKPMICYKKRAYDPQLVDKILANCNVTREQQTALREIIATAKQKSSRGRRYSEH